MIDKERKLMYLTLDMLMDPMFWLPLPVVVFFLGGKWSPLSTFNWYRKFYIAIGFGDTVDSGDMMDVQTSPHDPCGYCTDLKGHYVYHTMKTPHVDSFYYNAQ